MAALAIPPLEAAALWLLAALGVGVGGKVVSEEVRRRQQAASEAGTSSVAQTASPARTKTCEKCPPDLGSLVKRNWNMSVSARKYQARVTAFMPGTEWNFGDIDFDGFTSAECNLKEAKSRYDQFLTQGKDAELTPERWFNDFQDKMITQAKRQAEVAAAAAPARLTWFFEGPMTFEYMAPKVMRFPPLVAVFLF